MFILPATKKDFCPSKESEAIIASHLIERIKVRYYILRAYVYLHFWCNILAEAKKAIAKEALQELKDVLVRKELKGKTVNLFGAKITAKAGSTTKIYQYDHDETWKLLSKEVEAAQAKLKGHEERMRSLSETHMDGSTGEFVHAAKLSFNYGPESISVEYAK